MRLQLTSLLSRLTSQPDLPRRPAPGTDVDAEACAVARDGLPAAHRRRYDALFDATVPDSPLRSEVLERTLAATGSWVAALRVAEVWERLTTAERRALHDPVRGLAREGRQSDRTTCGSAVLTMLAAAGDPVLALWLATGELVTEPPPELEQAPRAALDTLADAPATARFAAVQRVMKQRTSASAVLGLPWPAALGTPPWTAARSARFLDVRFVPVMLTDSDRDRLAQALRLVGAVVDAGVPVPLYSGGDSSQGWSTALPRHVVLAIGRTPGGLMIWEPASGKVQEARTEQLLAGGTPQRALGGWSHLVWAVLPEL